MIMVLKPSFFLKHSTKCDFVSMFLINFEYVTAELVNFRLLFE